MRTKTIMAMVMLAGIAVLANDSSAKKGGKPGGGGGGGDEEPPADPRVLFTSVGEIHVMNEDGSNQTLVLATNDDFALHADWSPDGTRIVFESTRDGDGIYVMDSDGTHVEKLVAIDNFNWAHPVWSPDATADGEYKIAYTDLVGPGGPRAVFIVNTDGSGARQLSFPDAGSSGHWSVSWSPDATRIAIAADTEGSSLKEDVLVCDLDLDANDELAITTTTNLMSEADNPGGTINDTEFIGEGIAWAKASDRIAVSVRPAGGGRHQLYLIDVSDPVSPEHLVEGFHPSWSSDDSALVFENWRRNGNGRDVLRIDVNGANETTLVPGSKRWSPHAPVWVR